MKRWIVPVLVALAAHGLLLGLDPDWLRPMGRPPQERTLTLSLVAAPPPAAAVAAPKTASPAALPKAPPPRPRAKSNPPLPPPAPVPASIQPAPEPPPAPSVPMPAASTEKSAPALGAGAYAAPLGAEASSPDPSGESAEAQAEVRASLPLYDRNPAPVYPAAARRRNIEGTVMLEVLVDREGRAAQVRVLRGSGHAMLDRSALDSVRQWRFTPALRGDRPQEMWVQVPVRFELQK